MEMIHEKNKKLYLEYFQYQAKQFEQYRLKQAVITALGGAVCGLLFGTLITSSIGLVLGGMIGYKYPYYQLVRRKKHDDIVRTYMFPTFLKNLLNILEVNGNVYQSLKLSLEYSEEPLKTAIQELVLAIEEDKSQRPYLEFAKYIGSQEANQILGVLYQFTTIGLDTAKLRKLNETVEKLQANKLNELIQTKVTHLERFSHFPIVITLIYTMCFVGTLLFIHFDTIMALL